MISIFFDYVLNIISNYVHNFALVNSLTRKDISYVTKSNIFGILVDSTLTLVALNFVFILCLYFFIKNYFF